MAKESDGASDVEDHNRKATYSYQCPQLSCERVFQSFHVLHVRPPPPPKTRASCPMPELCRVVELLEWSASCLTFTDFVYPSLHAQNVSL